MKIYTQCNLIIDYIHPFTRFAAISNHLLLCVHLGPCLSLQPYLWQHIWLSWSLGENDLMNESYFICILNSEYVQFVTPKASEFYIPETSSWKRTPASNSQIYIPQTLLYYCK